MTDILSRHITRVCGELHILFFKELFVVIYSCHAILFVKSQKKRSKLGDSGKRWSKCKQTSLTSEQFQWEDKPNTLKDIIGPLSFLLFRN